MQKYMLDEGKMIETYYDEGRWYDADETDSVIANYKAIIADHEKQQSVELIDQIESMQIDMDKLTNESAPMRIDVDNMRAAIANIAPWLSASLDDTECKEYLNACNAIIELDKDEL